MNLELNFVNNYRMKIGDYKNAILYFEHIVKKYDFHAFAHYYLALCYEKEERDDLRELHIVRYFDITSNDEEWREYADIFGLPFYGYF